MISRGHDRPRGEDERSVPTGDTTYPARVEGADYAPITRGPATIQPGTNEYRNAQEEVRMMAPTSVDGPYGDYMPAPTEPNCASEVNALAVQIEAQRDELEYLRIDLAMSEGEIREYEWRLSDTEADLYTANDLRDFWRRRAESLKEELAVPADSLLRANNEMVRMLVVMQEGAPATELAAADEL